MTAPAYRWVILLFGILAYATSHFSRQNYTGIQRFIQQDFQLDRGAIGLLGASFFYAYAVFQMPWGIAADRFGSRAMATLGMLLTAATMVGFATSQSEEGAALLACGRRHRRRGVHTCRLPAVSHVGFHQNERGFSQAAFGGSRRCGR